jgi:zinc protease
MYVLSPAAPSGYKDGPMMVRQSASILAALLSVSTAAAVEIPFTRHRLPNGLTVILHEDHRLPLVAVNLWYHVGSADEPRGRSGFAHLFEHLMFMGTDGVPYPGFDTIMESQGGSNNASTSNDRTNYFESGPRHLLGTFLWLEADRMASLGSSMTPEKLDTQRDVVRNERRQSYENRPYGEAYLEIPARMYPAGHPYRSPVIGSHEDLERATLDDVREFFDGFYFPGNASLVIAGDFDPAEARALVEKHFGALPGRPPVERPPRPAAVRLESEVRATLEDQVEIPLCIFAWHSPAVFADGDAELDVLAAILGGGKASRLYRALVYEKKLAQEVSAHQASRRLGSELRITAHALPGASRDAVEAAIDEEIARIRDEGPTEREVERARNQIETSFWEEIQSISGRADLLNRYQFHLDDPGAIERDRARYRAVTPEAVMRWARAVLHPRARLVLWVVPKR